MSFCKGLVTYFDWVNIVAAGLAAFGGGWAAFRAAQVKEDKKQKTTEQSKLAQCFYDLHFALRNVSYYHTAITKIHKGEHCNNTPDSALQMLNFQFDIKEVCFICNKNPKFLVTNITYEYGVVDRNIIPCKKYLEQINFKKRFAVIDFPEEYLDNHIATDVSNINTKSKKEILRRYRESAVLKKSNSWIFVKGDMSTGKSFFAATLSVDAARNKLYNSISFVDVPERFKELTDLAFQKSPKFVELLDKIKNSEMLVLDDLGNEFRSEFVRDNVFFPILSYRAKNKLFTIITSNYSIEDICTMYYTNQASKPKIDQIRQLLNVMCKEEITLPSVLAQ